MSPKTVARLLLAFILAATVAALLATLAQQHNHPEPTPPHPSTSARSR